MLYICDASFEDVYKRQPYTHSGRGRGKLHTMRSISPVSYTHLDVYKRQGPDPADILDHERRLFFKKGGGIFNPGGTHLESVAVPLAVGTVKNNRDKGGSQKLSGPGFRQRVKKRTDPHKLIKAGWLEIAANLPVAFSRRPAAKVPEGCEESCLLYTSRCV